MLGLREEIVHTRQQVRIDADAVIPYSDDRVEAVRPSSVATSSVTQM